jgi:type IV pilus assembly protein PilE
MKKVNAFTLQELLIVLVIIGILVLIALPNLMPLISKAKSTEAQLQLSHAYTLEKNYFYMYSKYTNELKGIGYDQARLVSDGGNANYRLEVELASATEFRIRAVSITDFDGDGIFNVWVIDQDKRLIEEIKD